MTDYYIEWLDGRCFDLEDLDSAGATILAAYPQAEWGHPGDLSDAGDRTLIWEDAASAENDDGSKAVGVIRSRRAGER